MSLKGKTLFITGASRGIGLAIALRAARDGANIAVAAKTDQPHPKLPGTIHTAAADIVKAGGQALPLAVDVRDEEQVKAALARTAETFGGIDIVVNNASAVQVTPVEQTDMKRYDLMNGVNARGTFMVSKFAIPYLEKAANPHILMNSPPLDMQARWFAPSTAYTMAKFGMSMVVLGLAGELRPQGHCGERAVAACDDCDQRDPESARRRYRDANVAQARDHGGRGLCNFQQEGRRLHRTFPDRRYLPLWRGRARFRAIPGRSEHAAGAEFSSRRANRRRRRALSLTAKRDIREP